MIQLFGSLQVESFLQQKGVKTNGLSHEQMATELMKLVKELAATNPRAGTIDPEGELDVSVVDIRGDKVRLGFDWDQTIPIFRREVKDRRDAERQANSSLSSSTSSTSIPVQREAG